MTDNAQPGAASSSPAPGAPRPSAKRLPELTPRGMVATAIVIALLTAGAVIALWWPATAGLNGADLVKARLDALKIGLSVGVGSGGVVALYLAWRRQHSTEADLDNRERALMQQYEVLAHQQQVAATTQELQERVAMDARDEATQRRINELYLKAVEQLGSDKAPVRLGGLYALERLAQNDETQRQTVVNVFCAYLRMPYELPTTSDASEDRAEFVKDHRERMQEREVRLTAQRLLHDHLQPHRANSYWGTLQLDLTGALLINFELSRSNIGGSKFNKARFTGPAIFSEITSEYRLAFSESTFDAEASFHKARFGIALFHKTKFLGMAVFNESQFESDASFHGVEFERHATFTAVQFKGEADFTLATFRHVALFDSATFKNSDAFETATFSERPVLRDALAGDSPFNFA